MKINPYVRRMKKMEYTGLVGMKEERKSEKNDLDIRNRILYCGISNRMFEKIKFKKGKYRGAEIYQNVW